MRKLRRKKKQVWLCRDPYGYEIFVSEPSWRGSYFSGNDSIVDELCEKDFERVTGISLRVGEKVLVMFNVEKV